MLVKSPYSDVIAPVRATFLYTTFSAFILMLALVILGISFAFREGKKIRMQEEMQRLKEREDWQEKLLREKKTIDGIIEGSPIPSFVINRDHQIILWNRACVALRLRCAGDAGDGSVLHISLYALKSEVGGAVCVQKYFRAHNLLRRAKGKEK